MVDSVLPRGVNRMVSVQQPGTYTDAGSGLCCHLMTYGHSCPVPLPGSCLGAVLTQGDILM